MDRVISFSVSPTDTKGRKEVKKLKDHCKKTGISFSYLILKAITNLNKEIKNDN